MCLGHSLLRSATCFGAFITLRSPSSYVSPAISPIASSSFTQQCMILSCVSIRKPITAICHKPTLTSPSASLIDVFSLLVTRTFQRPSFLGHKGAHLFRHMVIRENSSHNLVLQHCDNRGIAERSSTQVGHSTKSATGIS